MGALEDFNAKATPYVVFFTATTWAMALLTVILVCIIFFGGPKDDFTKLKDDVASIKSKVAPFYGGMEGIGAANSRMTEKSSHFFGGPEAPTFYDTSAELALANLGSGGEVLEEYGEKHRLKYGMPVKKKAESFNPEKGLYGH